MYRNKNFKDLVSNKFNIKKTKIIKKILKKKILNNKSNLNKLEKIIHPFVRKEMHKFEFRNKKKRFVFFEIPLLVESKLMKKFDIVIFVKANKSLDLKDLYQKVEIKNYFKS